MTVQIFPCPPLHNNNVGHSEICGWTGVQALTATYTVYKPRKTHGSPLWLLISLQMSFFSYCWDTDLNEAQSNDNFSSIIFEWYGCQLFSINRVDCRHPFTMSQTDRQTDTCGRLSNQQTRLFQLKLRSHYHISHHRGISWSFNMNALTCIWATLCMYIKCVYVRMQLQYQSKV